VLNGISIKESQETGPIRQVAATKLPTCWGVFRMLGFERQSMAQHSPETAIVLVLGEPSGRVPLVRYALQDEGLDTVAANHALGFEADCRDFGLPAAILDVLGIQRIRLLSNNPEKRRALVNAGIVVEQIPCEASPNPHALRYLRVKKQSMGHTLSFV
jgi:GTP cyclohydrolase II